MVNSDKVFYFEVQKIHLIDDKRKDASSQWLKEGSVLKQANPLHAGRADDSQSLQCLPQPVKSNFLLFQAQLIAKPVLPQIVVHHFLLIG